MPAPGSGAFLYDCMRVSGNFKLIIYKPRSKHASISLSLYFSLSPPRSFPLAWSYYVCKEREWHSTKQEKDLCLLSVKAMRVCVRVSVRIEIDIHPQVIREKERRNVTTGERWTDCKRDFGTVGHLFAYVLHLPLLPYFTTSLCPFWVWLNCSRISASHVFACSPTPPQPTLASKHILTPTHLFSAQKCFLCQRVGWTSTTPLLRANVWNRVTLLCILRSSMQLFIQFYLFFPGGSPPCAHKPAVRKLNVVRCAVMQFAEACNERLGTSVRLRPLVQL